MPCKVTRDEARKKGMKRFFSGEACPHGHVVQRLVSNGTCITCSKIRLNAWQKKNAKRANDPIPKQKAIDMGLDSYFTNRPCIHGHTASRRVSDSKCRDCIKIKQKKRAAGNRDYANAAIKKWRIANSERIREHETKRRSNIIGTLSRGLTKRLRITQNGVCAAPWCELDIREKYHLDHINPISKGGLNVDENIQILCPACNLSKGAKDPMEWIKNAK